MPGTVVRVAHPDEISRAVARDPRRSSHSPWPPNHAPAPRSSLRAPDGGCSSRRLNLRLSPAELARIIGHPALRVPPYDGDLEPDGAPVVDLHEKAV
jgi:hypothetical protein